MRRGKGDMPSAREKRECLRHGFTKHSVCRSSSIRFGATQLAVVGWLAMSLPSTAATIPSSYRNDFRSCTGRLMSVGISSDAAATACAESLRPRDLSMCVARIERQTEIPAGDALATCRQVRRPNELANCVVGISRNSQEEAIPGVLNYCGRSLLPERFAECVVGLRREIDAAPTQAMQTCIDARDRLSGDFLPNFVPGNQTPPVQPPPPTPSVPRDLTPLEPDPPTPTVPQNQTPSVQPNLAPTAPANPGGV
jgi:hypothetical protein